MSEPPRPDDAVPSEPADTAAPEQPGAAPAPEQPDEAAASSDVPSEVPSEPAVAPEPAAETDDADPGGGTGSSGRGRRSDRLAAALIGVLTLLLGFAFAVQVRSVGDDDQYVGAR
jgi:uncharacterized membrane protein